MDLAVKYQADPGRRISAGRGPTHGQQGTERAGERNPRTLASSWRRLVDLSGPMLARFLILSALAVFAACLIALGLIGLLFALGFAAGWFTRPVAYRLRRPRDP